MADASGHDKEMENLVRAEIAVAGVKKREPQRIDDAAYGVEEPAGQQPGKGRVAQGVNELTKYGEAGPSHRDIYNRRNIFRTGHPAELEEHTGCCDTPYSYEKRISGIRCEHEQAYRRVGACDQDEDHQEPGLVGVHPNENTATVWLKAEDLIRIIREHGNEVVTFTCEEQ